MSQIGSTMKSADWDMDLDWSWTFRIIKHMDDVNLDLGTKNILFRF